MDDFVEDGMSPFFALNARIAISNQLPIMIHIVFQILETMLAMVMSLMMSKNQFPRKVVKNQLVRFKSLFVFK